MERAISEKTDARHYKADACMVWCFDDRFSDLLQKFIAARAFKHVDLIKVAGGAKGLANPPGDKEREYLLDQISKSVKLHQPPIIALMVHADCGACGSRFESGEAEQVFYAGELEKAETAVRPKISTEVKVEKYFANFSGLVKA